MTCLRASARTSLGIRGWMAVWRRPSSPCRLSKAWRSVSPPKAQASFGSRVQDTIHYNREERRFTRGANRAGGLEGGMTNGQDVLVRGLLKPISTLRRPLESVDLATREPALAAYERSDVCVVPAAGVIGEAMVAIVLAQAFLEKFGGDSLEETRRNFEGYREQVRNF